MNFTELERTDLRRLLGGKDDSCDDNTCIDEPPPITFAWSLQPPLGPPGRLY